MFTSSIRLDTTIESSTINKGQNVSEWTETWSQLNIESEIQMWDYFGGRPWVLKYTPRFGKVIEAGCGLGRYNFYLSSLGIDIIGLDFSEIVISNLSKWSERNNFNTQFILGNVTSLPFENNCLGGYLSFGVIEHFIEGPSRPLAEAFRVLRPGGVAIITTPNHSWSKKLKRSISSIKRFINFLIGKELKRLDFFQYEYSPKQLKKFIEKEGLKVTAFSGTDFLYTFTEIGKRPVKKLERLHWYHKISKIIDKSWFKKFGAQSITISIKTAEKMHCFFCGNLNADMISLETYTVPVCEECKDLKLSKEYLKGNQTCFHQDYLINPPIQEPHNQKCDLCGMQYLTHKIFENFGFNKHVCPTCLSVKENSLELSNFNILPVWRSRVK